MLLPPPRGIGFRAARLFGGIRRHNQTMRKIRKHSVIFAVVLLISCAVSNHSETPSFVNALVQAYEADSEAASPDEIWSFLIGGDAVFYVSPTCCDIPSTLYDKDGNILCHPDGGITGSGDGRCPHFHERRSTGVLIWRDSRAGMDK